MNEYQSNLIQKGNRYTIVEADEYDRSFLHLSPDFACITALDADHLDIFGSHANMKKAFGQFSKLVKQKIVVDRQVNLSGISYTVNKTADYYAKKISPYKHGYYFDLVTPTKTFIKVYLRALGRHNLSNAIGALAVLDVGGVSSRKSITIPQNI